MQNSPNLSKAEMQKQIDAMIVSSYKKTYQFVTEKKADVEKLAKELVEKGVMSSDDVYNLLGTDKPLLDVQEGPLPLSLVEDYKLRGWTENSEKRTPLINTTFKYLVKGAIQDPRLDTLQKNDDGSKVERKYYLNGSKAVEI